MILTKTKGLSMKTKSVHVWLGLVWLACCATAAAQAPAAAGRGAVCPPLLDRTVPRLQDEKPQSLCQYAGQVVLVVNTASRCGFTGQYKGLEALYDRYRTRGLVVLGFPSNDFGQQEPGSAREIADFCENQFGVRFPMFAKTTVRGPQASPLYADLSRLSGSPPQWNFHKYLIGRDGRSVRAYASQVVPDSAELVRDIERALAK